MLSANIVRHVLLIVAFINRIHGLDPSQQESGNSTSSDDGGTGNVQKSLFMFGNEDKYLNTSELLRKYGYPAEVHYVVTEDGYNLTLVRIPRRGPPVFLMHGLLSSSDDYLTAGPHKALAYLLANASYDVWVGNARGNKYCKRHVRLSPDQREFWEFSWNEIGYYDMPAMIDYALAATGRSQLVYVGHSQGTTVMYVLCSERPEYNKKISLFFSLATITYTWHTFAPLLRALAPFGNIENAVAYNTGFYELLPFDRFQFVTSVLCDLSRAAQVTCLTAVFSVFGFDYQQADYRQLSAQLSHVPAGAAVRQLTHYFQNTQTKLFAKYDYGKAKNLNIYGSEIPPSYPLENITIPIAIMYGVNDYLSSFEDVKILLGRLSNVVDVYRVPFPFFNHFDHLWAKDVYTLEYAKILTMINKHFNS